MAKVEETFPFDGDPPSKLSDETEAVLDGWMERVGPTLAEAHSEGLVTLFLVSSYDPLTCQTHYRTLGRGDFHAQIGMAQRFVGRQTRD